MLRRGCDKFFPRLFFISFFVFISFLSHSHRRLSLSAASYAVSQITAIIFHRYPRYSQPCSRESESNRDSPAHVIPAAGQCLSRRTFAPEDSRIANVRARPCHFLHVAGTEGTCTRVRVSSRAYLVDVLRRACAIGINVLPARVLDGLREFKASAVPSRNIHRTADCLSRYQNGEIEYYCHRGKWVTC